MTHKKVLNSSLLYNIIKIIWYDHPTCFNKLFSYDYCLSIDTLGDLKRRRTSVTQFWPVASNKTV